MNIKQRHISILVLIIGLIISGCGPGRLPGPTLTPVPTVTPTSTATPIPPQTLTPALSSYDPVPRWMILAQPGYSVEILGENWNYTSDRWGTTYGCIDYTRANGPSISFEQCFAMVDDTLTFEGLLAPFLGNDFASLVPNNTFGDIGQISLLGKRLDDPTIVEFFELIGTEKYILLVEIYVETDNDAPLQTIYENLAADIINYVLQDSLQKSRILPRPTPTPLPPNQESFYNSVVAKLITESQANMYHAWETYAWEALGDDASTKRERVCRMFEDRTNEDILWVGFVNCVHSIKDMAFEDIAYYYQYDVLLESRHEYDNKFVLYGWQDGHTFFDAYLLDGEYLYLVSLELRTVGQPFFSEDIDDFLYNVLMINVQN